MRQAKNLSDEVDFKPDTLEEEEETRQYLILHCLLLRF